jgi:O-antigen/teichoic acid export membrane protein
MSEGLPPEVEQPFWLSRDWWYRAGHTTVAVWVGTGLAFLATLVAARSLGPTKYGSVVLAVSLAGLIATLLDLTLEEAVVFHGSRLLAAQDLGAFRGLLSAALAIDALNALLVLAAVVSFAGVISAPLSGGNTSPALLRVAALAAFATTLDGTTGAVLLLARRPELRAWMGAWAALVRVAAILIALRLRAGPMAVVSAFAVASAIGAVSQGLVAWRVAHGRWPGREKGARSVRAWARQLIGFGIHTALATSVLAGRGALIPVVFGRLAGVQALGSFSVANLPVSAASVATGGVRMSLFREQAHMSAQGDWSRLRRSVRGHVFIGFAVGVPAAAIGYFLLPWLIPIMYSPAFSGSVTSARILLIAAVLYLALGWTKTLPAATGRPGLRTAVAGVDLGVSVLLVWALAAHESVGAATAVSMSTALLLVAWWLVLRSILTRMKQQGTAHPVADAGTAP